MSYRAKRHLLALFLTLTLATAARAWLITSHPPSFDSDEAVVGLMARHIMQGDRPVFFYGQAYMGSLDAWLVAVGFQVLGESVLTMRVVQSALYLLVVVTSYWLAYRLSGSLSIATATGLIVAVPPVVVALYTTATLGGYNEILLLGNLSLIFGYDVTHEFSQSKWRYVALGACLGLGWWTSGLIIAYALPLAVLVVRRLVSAQLPYYALSGLAALIFSLPWWIFDFQHDHAAIATFLSSQQSGEFAGIGIPAAPLWQRALGMIFLGFPALFGMRFSWEGSYFLMPVGVVLLAAFIVATYRLLRQGDVLKPDGRLIVLSMPLMFSLVFVASHFGSDPTGRYFVPLFPPVAIVLSTLVNALPSRHYGLWRLGALVLVAGYFAAGQAFAATSPRGFTPQFDPISYITNDYDEDVIDFLERSGLHHGYSNYWVAYRLAFLSQERIQYSAALPYKQDLSYNAADNRYSPYHESTERAEHIAYITTNLPELDQLLTGAFADQGIRYTQTTIGPYRIYHAFSQRVAPQELRLFTQAATGPAG